MNPIVEALVEDEIECMRKAWKAGSYYVLDEVIEYCAKYNRLLPKWATDAIRQELKNQETSKGLGRLANRRARDLQNHIHAVRWDTVKELRDRKKELVAQGLKPTWEAAYLNASDCLRGTIAEGSPKSMKRSYQIVKRSEKNGTAFLYRFRTNMPWNQPPIQRTA